MLYAGENGSLIPAGSATACLPCIIVELDLLRGEAIFGSNENDIRRHEPSVTAELQWWIVLRFNQLSAVSPISRGEATGFMVGVNGGGV